MFRKLLPFSLIGLLASCQSLSDPNQIEVVCPEGQAPSLPVGVRWMNTSLEEEWQEAQQPVGAHYEVEGVRLGTFDTVTAHVYVVADNAPLPQPQAQLLPLTDIHLTGNNLLTRNRDRDIETLLSFDISAYLYNYYDTYGLPTKGMKKPEGWDAVDVKLKGHGVGHYLSALALAYASCKDSEKCAALLLRIKTLVDAMRLCQERTFTDENFEAKDLAPEEELLALGAAWSDFDRYKKDWRHYGKGYINAIPPQHLILVEAYCPYKADGIWAPYYTVHKQLAGLVEVATQVDDKEVATKALAIARDMGLWIWNRLHYRTFVDKEVGRSRPGNRYEMWNMYIAGEVGGMQEVLARLASLAPDYHEQLLEAARCFDAPAFYDPLMHNVDEIRNRHANQHIPMTIGALQLYGQTAEVGYYRIAHNFWHLLQGRYTYATGGVGDAEMFREPYTQWASMQASPNLNETCCAYNLAKLSRNLALYHPNDACYMDYYERLLYNQIVGSLDTTRWAVTYHYAVGHDAVKPFGNETPQMSCCGGTGVENHVKYQEAAFFVGSDTLWLNLYLPMEAVWREKGVCITTDGSWPAEQMKVHIAAIDPGPFPAFVLKLRVPYWATTGVSLCYGGKKRSVTQPCSYVSIPIDTAMEIDVDMPFCQHLSYAPDLVVRPGEADSIYWAATVMRGPLAMAVPDSLPDNRMFLDSIPASAFEPDYSTAGPATHYLLMKCGKNCR